MVLVRSLAGNTSCILCNQKYTNCEEFCLLNSSIGKSRGKDLQALFVDVLGVKPVDGVICRKRCRRRLETVQRNLKVYTSAIARNTQEIRNDPTTVCENQVCYQIAISMLFHQSVKCMPVLRPTSGILLRNM